jgi:thiamine biosynthesis lipoprotein ApbE
MDLPSVKAIVKKWEKGFKSQNGRDPTKEEIKQDPSGIGASTRLR